MSQKRTISLVLGSGGARGLAHIGIIRWLEEHGFHIASVSGSSMGALIGGVYAMGKLGFSGLVSVLVLLLTAVIKGTLIIRDFMELRGVSLLWRVIMYGWLWGVTVSIAIIYLFSL